MMNRDKLMGAIGSSLIGVGSAVILYSLGHLKKAKNEEVVDTDIQDEIEEEMEAVTEILDEKPETAE